MLICCRGGLAAAGCAYYKADLEQVRLHYLLQRPLVLSQSRRQSVQTSRTTIVIRNQRLQILAIQIIKPRRIHAHRIKRLMGNLTRNRTVALNLSVIANPTKQAADNAGRATCACRQLAAAIRSHVNLQQTRRTCRNLLKLLGSVKIYVMENAETLAHRAGKQPRTSGGTHQSEWLQVQRDGLGIRAGVNHKVYPEILHRRVQILLDDARQAVNLVYEKHVATGKIREDAHQIRRPLERRTGTAVQLRFHLTGDDVRQGRLAKPRRPVQQKVLQHVLALPSRVNRNAQVVYELALADIVLFKRARP